MTGCTLRRWIERLCRALCLTWLLIGVMGSPSALAQGESPTGPVYVVQRGDTLSAIARRFGVSLAELQAANPRLDPNLIHPGDRLIIPGLEDVIGEIHPLTLGLGENLAWLAKRYGASPEMVRRLNHLLSPVQLYPGLELLVPVQQERPVGVLTLAQGETLLEAALRRGLDPWSLAVENDLPGLWAAMPGQWLLYTAAADEAPPLFPSPVRRVRLTPLPLVQGHTTVVQVETDEAVALEGELAGMKLHFFPLTEHRYVALQGIPAMAEPGPTPFRLWVQTADGGTWTLEQSVLLRSGGYGFESLHVDPSLVDTAVVAAEMDTIRSFMSTLSSTRYWNGQFVSPSPFADCFNSVFGTRRSYNDGAYNVYHTGLDFCGGAGVEIYAPAAGKVIFAGPLTVRGNATIIDHGWGVVTGYWHQSEIRVQVGDVVQPGQIIGLVGGTGRVTGAHLHWEMWVGGVPVDPLDWLQQSYP